MGNTFAPNKAKLNDFNTETVGHTENPPIGGKPKPMDSGGPGKQGNTGGMRPLGG